MATIQEVIDDLTKQATLIASSKALIAGLRQQVADFLSGKNVAPAVQAGIDSIFAAAEANNAEIAAGLVENTPNATP